MRRAWRGRFSPKREDGRDKRPSESGRRCDAARVTEHSWRNRSEPLIPERPIPGRKDAHVVDRHPGWAELRRVAELRSDVLGRAPKTTERESEEANKGQCTHRSLWLSSGALSDWPPRPRREAFSARSNAAGLRRPRTCGYEWLGASLRGRAEGPRGQDVSVGRKEFHKVFSDDRCDDLPTIVIFCAQRFPHNAPARY